MTGIMTIADAPNGRTVEVIDGPAHNLIRTGRIFAMGGVANDQTGHRYAWKRFTNERVTLHPSVRVVIDDDYRDVEGRWL